MDYLPEPEMFYLKWTRCELATLEMRALYTEVDQDGWVVRELGVDSDGVVAHQLVPTRADPGWFGLTRIAHPLESNVTKAEFECLWGAGRPPAVGPGPL